MTPFESTRPVADTLSYRLANSGPFRFIAIGFGSAVALLAPVLTVLLTEEHADIGGSRGTWLAILGVITALVYLGLIGTWMGRVRKRALHEVDAWATSIGFQRQDEMTLPTGLRIDPLSRSGRHRVAAGWHGTYRGHDAHILHYVVTSGTSNDAATTRKTIVAITSAPAVPDVVEVLSQRGIEEAARSVVTPAGATALANSADLDMRITWDQHTIAAVTRAHEARTAQLTRQLDILTDLVR